LFAASEVSSVVQPSSRAEDIWRELISRKGMSVFVSDVEGSIAATCMLIVVPNLLRSGRQHGFLENVVTHPEFRGEGHGTCVLAAALEQAWLEDCHHVLLQSGRADPRVHRFYESAGFIPGLRTSYVAMRPD
jgi:GNAT superfamily N-acetyltransferase